METPDNGRSITGVAALPISRLILGAMLLWPLALSGLSGGSITEYYFRTQDRYLIVAFIIALIALTYRAPRCSIPDLALRRWHVFAIFAALVLLLWWGTYALMANYALTRDEDMVLFDMAIFAKGHLLEPLAEVWRGNPKALVPDFLMDVPGSVALVSGYLPGNAMLRLAFSKIADPALMNPLLAGIGGIALFDIARRLFGADRRAVLVTMVLYIFSAQLLVTAMTVYAMTGHTALNLVWLALFMRGGKAGHGAAMVVGAVTMGLHQVVFHPLFVGPFLLWLLGQRRFGLVAVYAAFYTAAGIFWITYPALAIHSAEITTSGGAGDGVSFLRDRVWPLLVERDPGTFGLMSLNLFRLAIWQHLALIPLVLAARPLIRRNQGIAAPLAAGIVLTVAVCGFILPAQGHGWGYRYLAGFIGSFSLLGGLGYQRWAASDRGSADGVFVSLTALTLVFMTVTITGAQRFVAPYVKLDRLIAGTSTADMVLIDTELPKMAIDQVRNAPDLSNRPLRLSSQALDSAALAQLCERGSIALITRRDMHSVGFALEFSEQSPRFETKIARALAGKPCLVNLR
jgi:hypothetical protein